MTLVQDILDAEYRLVRAPAAFVERTLASRLPEESILRLGAEGGLGIMDTVAGRVTGNAVVSRRGRALIEQVKSSIRARWDERRASHLRNRAESQRARSYAHARRTEDLAHAEAMNTVDSTLNDLVQDKVEASVSAVDTATARSLDARDRVERRSNVAQENRKLEAQREHDAEAGRHEAEFWLGVADSNKS
ncbi:hypothetical protein [Smaragdicoccus niigatensis]|uniref:hypothetical protein n=1 Tax=Smaragdicoccus niigatensis TaxID=359359 RepID=UPI000368784C|nr:hypothetical protein [Smaragdicoccus niigatensis]